MPKALPPIFRIAEYTFTDEARQKSLVIMFVVCGLFIFLVRGCYQGNYIVNGQTVDAGTVIRVVSKVTFHMIAAGVMLVTALLSMRVLRRDRGDGMQSCILSKPIARWQYVAGKVLGLWALSTLFQLTLHGILFLVTSISLQAVMPAEYLMASLLCAFNLLFVVLAVLFLSLLMPDIIAFLCVIGIVVVGFVADGIFAISQSPMAQGIMRQPDSPSDWTWWKAAYALWPKLSAVQQFASSLIGRDGFDGSGPLYPFINVAVYGLILALLLVRRFSDEEIR